MIPCLNSIQTEQIIILGLFSLVFFADLVTTYFFFVKYTKRYPKDKNWFDGEVNFIIKRCWKKWGLHLGTIIGAIIIYPLFFTAMLFVNDKFFYGLLTGIYLITFITHFYSIMWVLKKKQKKKKKKIIVVHKKKGAGQNNKVF